MATLEATAPSAALSHRAPPLRETAAMRKCASTPTLRSLGDSSLQEDAGLEVYVVLHTFKECMGGVFHNLPEPLRDGVRDSGVCHYVTAFRQPDGTFVQFDFGPSAGGDIHVSRGPFAHILNKAPRGHRDGSRVEGTVRERKVSAVSADAPLHSGAVIAPPTLASRTVIQYYN